MVKAKQVMAVLDEICVEAGKLFETLAEKTKNK
jgi:hypothetical protein